MFNKDRLRIAKDLRGYSNTDFAEKLGCEMTDKGLIKVDETQKTTIDKIFACGDNSSPLRTVANAVSSGNIAGMLLNNTIIENNF